MYINCNSCRSNDYIRKKFVIFFFFNSERQEIIIINRCSNRCHVINNNFLSATEYEYEYSFDVEISSPKVKLS